MPEAKTLPLTFPFRGLSEYEGLTDQQGETSPDLQNVVAVDPISGRRRGAQRPGIAKFVSPLINGMSSIQDINHITGPNFDRATGEGQLIGADPSGASWTLIDNAGSGNPGGGAGVYQMSCWDNDGNVYIAARPNSTDMTVTVKKFNLSQVQQWTVTITHGSSSSAIQPVAGMAVIGSRLFILFDGASAYNDAIYRYYTSTGANIDGGAWATAGVEFVGTPFQTHHANYLAASAGFLGVVSTAGVAGMSDLKLWLDVLNPESKTVISTTAVQTVTNDSDVLDTMNCYALEGDGTGNFFISGIKYDNSVTTYTSFIEYRDSAGVAVSGWATPVSSTNGATDYAADIAYDLKNDRLAAVGPNVMNYSTGFSMVVYGGADKAVAAGIDAAAITEWRRVYADSTGGFRLTRNNNVTNVIKIGSDLSATADWTTSVDEDDQDRALSINTVFVVLPDTVRPRQTKLVVTAGGTPMLVDRELNTVSAITSGTDSLSASAVRIFSSAYYPKLFFADGVNTKFYDPQTGFINNWTSNLKPGGSLPVDSNGERHTLIANWNARLVLSGVAGDPQNWFMSAQADPLDFDYAPATTVSSQAVSGNTSNAGTMQDVINSLMPWERDYLLIGMDHSISALSGNPVAGGRFDTLTDVTGVAWGRPFSMHPDGSMWFIGSRGGLYRLGAGERKPQRLSETTIDERLADLALDTVIVEMQWDDRMQGFLIIISPIDQTSAATHYLYDVRNNAWFPWSFATVAQNPKVVHLLDGDAVADRVVLLGSWDGYLRTVSYDSDDDDGVAIDSYVMIGPLQTGEMVPLLLSGLQAVLGASASDVTYSVHVGDSAEEALAAAESFGGKFAAGRGRWSRQRVTGHAIYIKLRNSANNETWSLERLNAMVSQTSEAFARRF